MADTSAKKEKQKKKAKAKQEKAEKMRDRKANSKSKSLEDMLAYIDENGNLSSTPPDPFKKKIINVEDIQLGAAAKIEEEVEVLRKGVVTYFNDAKGYGFISDSKTKENVFVHLNQLSQPIKERDIVTFEVERNAKGLSAIKVTKVLS